jgi:DNA mismatch repair protein MutL
VDALSTLALAHPACGFTLEVDGSSRLMVPPGQSREERLTGVWGRQLAGTLVPVSYGVGGFRIEGLVQRPADAQPTGRRTQLFVNGRPFRDPFLVRAAEAGYRAAIHPGDRPSLFLDIAVAPDQVDVNVHPAKLEVRFRERIGVERAVEEAVRHALGALMAAASIEGRWGAGEGTAVATGSGILVDDLALPMAPSVPGAIPEESFAAPLMQVFDTYIVYESPDGLVIVDQHSAHERIIYESAMTELASGRAASQQLLLPLTIELTDEELDAVESHRAELAAVGFEVEAFGGRAVAVHAVPAPHPRFDAGTCFREMVADLARGRFGGWANRLERFAATYGCRAAVKGGQRLSEPEMRRLLLRLFETDLPPHDVHGRSTIVQLPRDELERRFGRR